MAAIVNRGGIDEFLALVERPNTRGDALWALHALPRPPVNDLVAALSAGAPARRGAAALALGSLCHAGTLPLLEQIARDDARRRREALVALLSCRDGAADETIDRLSGNHALAAQIRSLRQEIDDFF
jgi:hypothetical protein